MPSQDTDGKVPSKNPAAVDLSDRIFAGALRSAQRTWRENGMVRARERGGVTGLELGDGTLVVETLQAKADLVKSRGDRVRSTRRARRSDPSRSVASPRSPPDTGPLEVPGVASIEPTATKRTQRALTVIDRQVTLLDGTGAVIDLGTATIGGNRSGR